MKARFRLALAAVLASLVGCIMAPVPSFSHKVVSGTKVEPDDLVFIRLGVTERNEITRRFGSPWIDYGDIHVLIYYWENLAGYWLFNVGAGYAGAAEEITKLHYLFIKLDPQGRVLKWEIFMHPKKAPVKILADEWSREIAEPNSPTNGNQPFSSQK
jgi:hypothetical protein